MNELNKVPSGEEQTALADKEVQNAAVGFPKRMEPPLLTKVRQKFEITGFISLLFGVFFTFCFYRAKLGFNALLFTLVMVVLLVMIMKKYEISIRRGTWFYYLGAALFGLSAALTSSDTLQLLNIIAILLLLNLSLLHQFHDTGEWDVLKSLGKMLGMLLYGIASIGMPFLDSFQFLKKTRMFRNDRVRSIFAGILLAIPFLWIIILLLSQADIIFGDMTRRLALHIFSGDIILIAFLVFFGFLCCYSIICGAAAQTGREEYLRKKGDASVAITVILLITIVYAVFCGLQIVYLFNSGLFALPQGYTFAEYARRGFFELLAVAVLNVVLMLLGTTYFEENRFLRHLLTIMTACTYVMIGSATYRMLLYISAYRLTFLRLFVLLALAVIALFLAGVILSVYRRQFPLFRYGVVVIAVSYLIFSLAKPDHWIAVYLEQGKVQLTAEDAAYLTRELSLDASATVLKLLSDESRWTEDAKQGKEMENSLAEYEEYMFEEVRESNSIDYYNESYHERIKREREGRGLRDYNPSVSKAWKEAKNNPIRYYKQ